MKSQFADELTECYVKFSFENKGKRYEIKRTPAQMKQRRNGNCSLQNATALLTLEDGTIISKIGEVNKQIEEILGLNAEQFRKIIMLPQGNFAAFFTTPVWENKRFCARFLELLYWNNLQNN